MEIPARFNGPPGSGNGGYTAGRLASFVDAPAVEVTLRAPPPLDTPLVVDADGDGVAARHGDTLVATARPVVLDIAAPAPPPPERAAAAMERAVFLDEEAHPFPSCFVCGPRRAPGDGLRIFAGPLGDGRYAAAWTPDASLAGDDGALPAEVVWASLDCPTSAPIANDPGRSSFLPVVLGRLAVRIDAPVVAGEPHVVIAWPIGIDGRKRQAGAALYGPRGELCGVSRALWIELRAS
jgi:hypothetical protein